MLALRPMVQNLQNLLLKLLVNIRWCMFCFISSCLLNILMVRFEDTHMEGGVHLQSFWQLHTIYHFANSLHHFKMNRHI